MLGQPVIVCTIRRTALVSGSSAALLAGVGAQAQTAFDDILKAKTLKVAIPTDYPPYGFVGTDMAPQGLDVDMAKLIAVFAAKTLPVKSWADLAGKSVAVTRGAMEDQELAKVAPAGVDVKRFEDNNATIALSSHARPSWWRPAPRWPAT